MISKTDNNEHWIYGYKVFDDYLFGLNEQQIEVGKIYIEPNIECGNRFHFCKNLEDTFIFARGAFNIGVSNPSIYQVCGDGVHNVSVSNYYDVDVYLSERLKIIKKLSREEIIQYYLSFHPDFYSDRLLRFIELFALNEDEILLFKDRFKSQDIVLRKISYYQEDRRDPFIRQLKL